MPHHDTPTVRERELALEHAVAAHAACVEAGLRRQIDAGGGFLSFEHFMDYALYAPGLGYYSGGAQKLGKDGDFTTAPEVSRLFGACVAVQCAEVMAAIAQPVVLEIGAGTGRLAVDVLTRLESLGALPAQYWILESSADLRDRQGRLLDLYVPHLRPRVQWLDAPPADDFEGVIIANEVLDALPVARFRWNAGAGAGTGEGGVAGPGSVEELGVVVGEQGFAWGARPAGATMSSAVADLRSSAARSWEDGYQSEYCPRLSAWTHAVTAKLTRGCVLWFDYGLPRAQYYFPQRHQGTLLCHYRHRAHDDPFLHPGLQDITAWVDFTALAEASQAAGFELAGFTTQAHFLAATGIDQEMQHLAANDGLRFARLASEARQLMLPGEMGERFKVMAWLRGMDLRGLSFVDLRHSL
jgi:SAM-dependent MidA family methyltransferase